MVNHISSNTDSFDRAEGTMLRGVQQAGDSLHSTIDRVAEPVKGVVDRASASAHQTVDRIASGVHAAAEKVDAQTHRVRQLPDEALENTRAYVRSRPLQTVAIALAVGWLFGRLGAH